MRKNLIYFDSHTHYNIEPLLNEWEKHLETLVERNYYINIIGTNIDNSIIAINQAKKYNFICSVGVHPCDCYNLDLNETINKLEELILNHNGVIKSIGECGLDYHYEDTNKEKQLMFFKAQIALALKHNLNLIIHVRDAHSDLINILKEYDLKKINVVIHCFSGTLENLNEYQRLNCYISISGVITFKNSQELNNILKYININKLLTETDSPYLSPVPLRGNINNSLNVKIVNEYIANQLNININELNARLKKNFYKFFFNK